MKYKQVAIKPYSHPPPPLGCPYPVSQYLHDVTFWAARFLVAVRGPKSIWGGGGKAGKNRKYYANWL
jgi:hypothetical protein